ncbi:hypothetical protein [Sphingomicrobium nitratireducens]|uniref:hypothetical protein n=1 Tax=Sphingomicrobium nitratireducens TaxID=2964666 RepID=UPI0022408AEF|nr:hypothetical protein [Sphingomicrobium nitratireducens]
MANRALYLAALSLALASPAIAQKFELSLQAQGGQRVKMIDGLAAIESFGETAVVRMMPIEEKTKKRGRFQILVMNAGSKPFNVGPENVTISLDGAEFVPAVTYEQLAKEEKKRQTWAAVGAALGAIGNSMNAANAGYSSGTATTFGNVGGTSFNSFTTYSGYNAGQAQAAQQLASLQNQQLFDSLAAQNAAGIAQLKDNMRTTTIDPGEMSGGMIVYDVPKETRKGAKKAGEPIEVIFRITTGSEIHDVHALLEGA